MDYYDEPDYDPEDCPDCGLPAGEFSDDCWDNGCWQCPECGAVQ